MRRLRLAVGIGHLPGLDGVEGIIAVRIGTAAAESLERRIRQRALILRIRKATLRIGLPDLQHAIADRLAVAVKHPAFDPDAFARSIRGDEVTGEGVVPLVFAIRRQAIFEKRTDGLRWRNSFFGRSSHYLVSIGVAWRPRSTMLKR